MPSLEQPTCLSCGARHWKLQCQVRILLYANGDDPSGAFKREMAVDSVHDLSFWCDSCGEGPAPRIASVLEGLYRGHDALRAAHPTQGALLSALRDDPDGPVRLIEPPMVVRPPMSSPLS
jgi:hypothetical protein